MVDCIEQPKLTFFACDAAERLKYYMMCSVKKPERATARQHVCRMEFLNKYLGMLPTIKNSPMAVASTELGNVPFTKATHASIILSHLPVAWRNQYDLTHKTGPESPRAMLMDLKNIKKMQVEKYNEKAKASKARQLQQRLSSVCPRNVRMQEVQIKEPPRKAVPLSIPSGARQRTAHSRPTILQSVVGLRRMAAPRTGWLSPSTPLRSPGRRRAAGIPVRWLI